MTQAETILGATILNYNLKEGLKVGDMDGILNDVLTIDEFDSKIDPDAIVVAFTSNSSIAYPMDDLSEFIENGSNEVLDTEVSHGPNKDGNYLLFVEFVRNENFPKNLQTVLNSMKSLTLIYEWNYTF